MVFWIVLCTIWFNFVLGALIPITPKLNEEMAGLAFSSFVFIKILVFIPAGWIGDKIGHYTGFFISLVSQVVTLWLIIKAPEYIWAARSAEGVSLAFGTISALALLRAYSKSKQEFGRSVAMMMGIGSSGVLLGPFFGYLVDIDLALKTLLLGSVLFCIVHWILLSFHTKSLVPQEKNKEEAPTSVAWKVLLAFAFVKGLGVGIQPLLGWWATHEIGLTGIMAGLTFVAASLGFMIASYKPNLNRAYAGILGLIMLELALSGQHFFWWPGLICLGLFSGTIINLALAKLGWNNFENIGFQNSKFLLLSDIPMMILPGVLWELRDSSQAMLRIALVSVLLISTLFLARDRA